MVMQYRTLPELDTGDEFTNAYWNQIRANQEVLNNRSGQAAASIAANQLVVGGVGNTYVGHTVGVGELVTANATGIVNISVGTDGQVLVYRHSPQATTIAWENEPALSTLRLLKGV